MRRILLASGLLALSASALAASTPVTANEIVKAADQPYASADLDHDGVVSAEERRLAHPGSELPRLHTLPPREAVSITRLRRVSGDPLMRF